MIPKQILNPEGCEHFLYEDDFTDNDDLFEHSVYCGTRLVRDNKLVLCPQCKNIQKAQTQTLLDEKIREIKILSKIDNIWSKQEDSTLHSILLDRIHTIVCNKYNELQEEIKVLEELI